MRTAIPADSAAFFRIGYGLLAAFSAVRFLLRGWVDDLYLEPANHLTYAGFSWVRPLPAPWMHLFVALLAILGVAVAAGYRYRLSLGLYIVGFGYTELIEASLYLNHYWFFTLAGVLLWVLPVDQHWSLDARAGRTHSSAVVPAGVVVALRCQLAVVYLFAGLAKLNPDWLLRGEPMTMWLRSRSDLPVVGPLLALDGVGLGASWIGAAFDCTIVFWLLWRRTRLFAYGVLLMFHIATGVLFRIGVFPIVMVVSTLVFFEPDWPRRVWQRVWRGVRPGVARSTAPCRAGGRGVAVLGRGVVVFLAVFASAQVLLPLRHLTREGNVRWNEDGYYLSWRVMLTEKAGYMRFRVTDPSSGRVWEAGPDLVLLDWQASHAATRPDLIVQTARLVAQHYAREGMGWVEVRADVWVAMNGRPARRMIDPNIDLAGVGGSLPSAAVLAP